MILSVHQPQYIPWLGYFDKIARSDCFVILDQVQYKSREYQNRNRIRTKNGSMWLTVPVKSKGRGREKICDIHIDNSNGWRKKHCNSLKAWYKGARFFHRYFPFFEEVLTGDWEKLEEINMHIIQFMLKELDINTTVYFESDLDITSTKTDRIIDLCRILNADIYLSGSGGRDYLEEEKFEREDIRLVYQDFTHPTYRQQYMARHSGFMPHMSCIDLLFNEGEKSREILRGKNRDNKWYIH
jgi:hypothetical protein